MNKNKIMRKITILSLVVFCTLSALDWYYDTSTRIEALGIDFAGVIKDRQTDIDIRNSLYLNEYRAVTAVHRGYYYTNHSMPVNFSLFYNKFGFAIRYGGHYFLNLDQVYPKDQLYRFNFSGYWIVSDIGLYYDGYFEDKTIEQINNLDRTTISENFTFHTITFGYQPKVLNGFDMRCRLSLGTYDSVASEFVGGQLAPIGQINFLIPSAQVGLSYERSVSDKSLLCLLVDMGGPASAFETKRLPISFRNSVKRNELGEPDNLNLFANSFSTRIAGAISFYPNQSMLISLGVNEFWSGVKTKQSNPITFWYNFFVLPLAIEYQPNKSIAVRGGFRTYYYYQFHKQEQSNEGQIYSSWGTAQSYGLGFRVYQNWYLDLSSLSNLLQIESINLALRREW